MANRNSTHAHHFVQQLNPNERNSLRVLLLTKSGLTDLREALGLQHMQVVSVEQECFGHAVRGTTAKLFRGFCEVSRCVHGALDESPLLLATSAGLLEPRSEPSKPIHTK